MRAILLISVTMSLLAGACGGSGGTTERQVLVDFSSDEFASFAYANFPEKVVVRQGDVVNFKQNWTGEPHTVTGGTAMTTLIVGAVDWIDFFDAFDGLRAAGAELPDPENPGSATVADLARQLKAAQPEALRAKALAAYTILRAKGIALPDLDNPPDQSFADLLPFIQSESDKAFSGLPSAFTDNHELAQNLSQPCYLRTGSPPEDQKQPCARKDQRQPEFDGRQSVYSSGVIPYEGTGGNTFRVRIAQDATPGTYEFFCAVHGPGQRTKVEIKPAGAKIPSQGTVARSTRDATRKEAEALAKVYRDATDDLEIKVPGPDGAPVAIKGPFAGLIGSDHTGINEFVPKVLKAKAGEPITWRMMGNSHTISFNVPKYFPIMEFLDSGLIRINPRLQKPAGGAIPVPEEDDNTVHPVKHDGGTFDGRGFWSSGLIGSGPYLEYTMRITKPGTYNYACLLHPAMTGRIEVT